MGRHFAPTTNACRRFYQPGEGIYSLPVNIFVFPGITPGSISMNSRQARFLLHGYRANGRDAGDPLFREALRQAADDPRTIAWLENARCFDATISDRLDEVPVPPDLRETISAGVRLTEAARARQWSRRLLGWLVVAAIGAACFCGWILWWSFLPGHGSHR